MVASLGPEVFTFMFLGLLGGISYVIINSEGWSDLTSFSAFKRYALAIISGFIYDVLYSEYSYPNFIMAYVSGYMGTSFIQEIVDRFTEKEELPRPPV